MMMTAEKIVHHQLYSNVGLSAIRDRGAGGCWSQRPVSRGSSIAKLDIITDAIAGCESCRSAHKGRAQSVGRAQRKAPGF
jgi:hypothetical protein